MWCYKLNPVEQSLNGTKSSRHSVWMGFLIYMSKAHIHKIKGLKHWMRTFWIIWSHIFTAVPTYQKYLAVNWDLTRASGKFNPFPRSLVIKHFSCLVVIKIFFQRFGRHVFVIANTFSTVVIRTTAHIPGSDNDKNDDQHNNNDNTSNNTTWEDFLFRFITWKLELHCIFITQVMSSQSLVRG